jgi:hypothetical protein
MQANNLAPYISCGIAFVALLVTLIAYLSQRRPRIVFYCELDEITESADTSTKKQSFKEVLVAKNIGKTPAMKVKISFLEPFISGEAEYTGDHLTVLMPDATHDVYSQTRLKWVKYGEDRPITVSVEYEDISLPRLFNLKKHHLHRATQQVSWTDGQQRSITGGYSENLESKAMLGTNQPS